MAQLMPKTLDDLVRETLGSQVVMILQLQAENAALREQVAALTPTPAGPPAPEGST